ncbi:CD225/dispanin family protein [Yimella sp. cx-51]|nr:CD225/dispanin family protein [Yimella sp. cx-51]
MPGGGGPVGTPPNNNLVIAILSTVLCCLPLGIYAIIQATKVNGLWQQGDTAGAQKAADDAKKFSIIGAVVGLVISVIYMILMFTVLNNSNA